jgi:transcription elongation factor GreA
MALRKESPMNQPICLTKAAFELLLSNLLEIEEGLDEIIDEFFSQSSKEAEVIKGLLNEYVRRLDKVIPGVIIDPDAANDFPYVVVGGEVIVEESDSGETYCYKLVSPHNNNIGFCEISFLSPMGKALLWKKTNDRFIVEAPGGNYEYKVLSIKIRESGDCSLTQ